jgi:hypothetical protein
VTVVADCCVDGDQSPPIADIVRATYGGTCATAKHPHQAKVGRPSPICPPPNPNNNVLPLSYSTWLGRWGWGGGASAILGRANFLQSAGVGSGRRVNGMTKEEFEQCILGIQVAQNNGMQKMAAIGMPTMQAWQQQQQQQQQQQSQSQNLLW